MLAACAPIKVFLADDSAGIRVRVAGKLQTLGMAIVGEAATPAACIDGILSTRPDVVVLDVQLENGFGLQVLQAVLAAAPQIRFVVFSNAGAPAYRRRYLESGALEFLDKSCDYHLLGQAVERAAASAAD